MGETNTHKVQPSALKKYIDNMGVTQKMVQTLGEKKGQLFVASMLSAVATNNQLKDCAPGSVVSAAMVAAQLDLPINASLGYAYIVPYKKKAQFQIGYKGFIQLAMRTGQYETMNVIEVRDGDIKKYSRLTGELELNTETDLSKPIIGYLAFFRLVSGFSKTLYMTKEEVTHHAKKYSQSFNSENGRWKNDFDAMAMKTVIKRLLSKWGIMSIEMQNAARFDQSVLNEKMEPEYPDNPFGYNEDNAGESEEPAEKIEEAVVIDSDNMSSEEFIETLKFAAQFDELTDEEILDILKRAKLATQSLHDVKPEDHKKALEIISNPNRENQK